VETSDEDRDPAGSDALLEGTEAGRPAPSWLVALPHPAVSTSTTTTVAI
jgi:hypothetical protein